jgi:hypothetical protein
MLKKNGPRPRARRPMQEDRLTRLYRRMMGPPLHPEPAALGLSGRRRVSCWWGSMSLVGLEASLR